MGRDKTPVVHSTINKKSKHMAPEQQQSIVKTLQAALTTVEEKWNDRTESQAWMVGYLEGTIKQVIREME